MAREDITSLEGDLGRVRVNAVAWSIAELMCSIGAQLVLTPLLFHRLGVEQFGAWVIAQTIVVGSATLSLGAGTALLPVLAHARARGDTAGARSAIRFFCWRTLTVSAFLFVVLGIAGVWGPVPTLLSNWTRWELWAIAAAALAWAAVTEIDNGLSSALKARDRFDAPALIELGARTVQVGLTFWAIESGGVALLVVALAVSVTIIKVAAKLSLLWRDVLVHDAARSAEYRHGASVAAELRSSGFWIWLSVLSGLIFNAFDRWFVGAQLGSVALAAYATCAQVAQVPHAVAAAAGQTLAPWSAKLRGKLSDESTRRRIRRALLLATPLAALPSLMLLLVLEQLLALWITPDFAAHNLSTARSMTLAFGLLALNVPSYFLLFGLGRVRFSSILGAAAGIVFVIGCLLVEPSMRSFVLMKGLFATLTLGMVIYALNLSRTSLPR